MKTKLLCKEKDPKCVVGYELGEKILFLYRTNTEEFIWILSDEEYKAVKIKMPTVKKFLKEWNELYNKKLR